MGVDRQGLAASEPTTTEGASAPSYLSVAGLTKRFGAATVVSDVAFEAAPSEFLCVLGPSGCGKTTLLRLIAGFERADEGRIRQAGVDITDYQLCRILLAEARYTPGRDIYGMGLGRSVILRL